MAPEAIDRAGPASAVAAPRSPGVTISVAPITRGVAAGLIAILLAGLTSAVAIGLLAADPEPLPLPSVWLSTRR